MTSISCFSNTIINEATVNTTGFILFYIIFVQPSTSFLAVLVKQGKKTQKKPRSSSAAASASELHALAEENLGEDRCSPDGMPDFCSPNWHSLLSHSSQQRGKKRPRFNIIPSLVWFDALVPRQITRLNTASNAPTATLLSLSSQICLCYACHSKAPWLIAFKIEMESRSQLLNTSPSHLLSASEAAKLSRFLGKEMSEWLTIKKHPAMLLIVARIRD